MYLENAGCGFRDSEKMAISMMNADDTRLHMTGQSIDRIFKNGVLVEEIVDHNLVVNSFLNLVMCLVKQQSGYKGIQYWAVGKGSASWDGAEPPAPAITDTRLTSEIGRVPIAASEIVFLNSNYEVVNTPTNIIQISHIFGTADCNGEWREFGIFGGNGTTAANSGIMINKRHHKVINKSSDMTVERIMRFTLNLV